MSDMDKAFTDAELRWSYRRSSLAQQGISLEAAQANPALRAVLELGASISRRKRQGHVISPTGAGIGIERSHPDFHQEQ